ncbi:hypothetical protein GCM10012285_36810 [Streptomyces kronopolitis]|uniref:Secreted protein n=1 Tax=Streptomyces kronopolitis TaxID=1612435 RepID=A0ABQ2JL56_9ACTN|nr:hypothetical protein GCM10012285_36810 [Streptomyces kronopolitis]
MADPGSLWLLWISLVIGVPDRCDNPLCRVTIPVTLPRGFPAPTPLFSPAVGEPRWAGHPVATAPRTPEN